jgi:hypothetical protein
MAVSPLARRGRALAVLAAAWLCAGIAPATASAAPDDEYPTDVLGFTGTAAHCQGSAVAVVVGRTQRALVVVCSGPDGQYQYRGVRLTDDSALMLSASPTSGGGFRAENDGVVYTVSPDELRVSSGDATLYRGPWIQYRDPRSSLGG